MSEVLGHFLQALRASDVRVSTAEGMDAARVFGTLGFDDRLLLKTALSQVLAKSIADKASFDDCFERFFRAEDLQDLPPADETADAAASAEGRERSGLRRAGLLHRRRRPQGGLRPRWQVWYLFGLDWRWFGKVSGQAFESR